MQKIKNLSNVKLSIEEEKIFKKKVKVQMIELDLTYADLSARTGYSVSAISNALCENGAVSKFLTLALADTLKINLDDIRREVKNGK